MPGDFFRFFDIPKEYQNEVREDGLDFGGQVTYRFNGYFHTDFEVFSDHEGNWYANVVPAFEFESGRWEIRPSLRLRYKSRDFNNRYYGLGIAKPGSATDFKLSAELRYHRFSNIHLLGKASLTFLDADTREVEFIDKSTTAEAFIGLGFFKEKKKASRRLESRPYVRLAHGWATPSSLHDIIRFNTEKDPYSNQLTSVFFGVPLADELLTLPIATYLTPGLVWHHASKVRDATTEYVLAVKFYYTVKWPVTWRLGFAEGLSYAVEVPYVEQQNMASKNYRPCELLNYLDF